MRKLFLALIVGLVASISSAHELDEAEIKRLAVEALLENPDVVFEAIAIVRAREQERMMANAVDPERALVLGDVNAPITIVEFFDYNCGFCKRATSVVRDVLAANDDVKLVLRELPILSEGSRFAARAALAAREQGMYEAFHWALMDLPRVTEETTMEAAAEIGLDVDQLRADMNAASIDDHLEVSREVAEALGVTGTPAFLVGTQFVGGYVDGNQMAQLIENARQ